MKRDKQSRTSIMVGKAYHQMLAELADRRGRSITAEAERLIEAEIAIDDDLAKATGHLRSILLRCADQPATPASPAE